jgi:gas vesicle protein
MKLQSFISGVAVGMALGVLFAPDSGEETRRKISRNASRIRDSVKDTYDEVAGKK